MSKSLRMNLHEFCSPSLRIVSGSDEERLSLALGAEKQAARRPQAFFFCIVLYATLHCERHDATPSEILCEICYMFCMSYLFALIF